MPEIIVGNTMWDSIFIGLRRPIKGKELPIAKFMVIAIK